MHPGPSSVRVYLTVSLCTSGSDSCPAERKQPAKINPERRRGDHPVPLSPSISVSHPVLNTAQLIEKHSSEPVLEGEMATERALLFFPVESHMIGPSGPVLPQVYCRIVALTSAGVINLNELL